MKIYIYKKKILKNNSVKLSLAEFGIFPPEAFWFPTVPPRQICPIASSVYTGLLWRTKTLEKYWRVAAGHRAFAPDPGLRPSTVDELGASGT